MLKSHIRTIPHYPKQGVMFRDVTTLLKDAKGLRGRGQGHSLRERYEAVAGQIVPNPAAR